MLIGYGVWAGDKSPLVHDVKHGANMIRGDGLDHFYLCLGLADVYILDLASELDSRIVAGDTIILTVPRKMLNPAIRSTNLRGTVLTGPLGALLGDHLRALRRQLPQLTPEEMPHVERATVAMIAAALAAYDTKLAATEREINLAALERVRRYIDANLQSPDLSPAQICREVGISRAQLYRLFSRESGVSAHILQRRLESVRQVLQSPKGRGQRISALAFQYGFKSESHFSRRFREAFGCSPSEAREKT